MYIHEGYRQICEIKGKYQRHSGVLESFKNKLMNTDKELDINCELEKIDLALETIQGAMKDIQEARAQIHDILNGTTGDELFRFDRIANAEERVEPDLLDNWNETHSNEPHK